MLCAAAVLRVVLTRLRTVCRPASGASSAKAEPELDASEPVTFHTRVARGVYNTLFNRQPPVRNELFQPGRMAYLVDLEDDQYAVTDVPKTVIRSKAECPEAQKIKRVTTNDIVINKLIQILSYLRTGSKAGAGGKRLKRKEKKKRPETAGAANAGIVNAGAGAGAAKASPVDADRDMFEADDGDEEDPFEMAFKMSMAKPRARRGPAPASSAENKASTTSYFGSADAADTADAADAADANRDAQAGDAGPRVDSAYEKSGMLKAKLKAKQDLIKNVIAQFGGAGKAAQKAGAGAVAAADTKLGKARSKEKKRKALGIDNVPDIYSDGNQLALLAGGYGDEEYGDDDDDAPARSWHTKPPQEEGAKKSRQKREQKEEQRFNKDFDKINELIEKRKAEKQGGGKSKKGRNDGPSG